MRSRIPQSWGSSIGVMLTMHRGMMISLVRIVSDGSVQNCTLSLMHFSAPTTTTTPTPPRNPEMEFHEPHGSSMVKQVSRRLRPPPIPPGMSPAATILSVLSNYVLCGIHLQPRASRSAEIVAVWPWVALVAITSFGTRVLSSIANNVSTPAKVVHKTWNLALLLAPSQCSSIDGIEESWSQWWSDAHFIVWTEIYPSGNLAADVEYRSKPGNLLLNNALRSLPPGLWRSVTHMPYL